MQHYINCGLFMPPTALEQDVRQDAPSERLPVREFDKADELGEVGNCWLVHVLNTCIAVCPVTAWAS